ncbi:hypothetical protein E2562_003986 [Oryza meyeriana var. granulata]|uniref:Uncharacterized protein n=1 Tax=Oryza meyeriana var. granulata TaxID=110450 RepID=A0A6G1BK06_9ORYZ|nr:hypothetical protein E2562_003986 [Oryza meyeriana var. granulata]
MVALPSPHNVICVDLAPREDDKGEMGAIAVEMQVVRRREALQSVRSLSLLPAASPSPLSCSPNLLPPLLSSPPLSRRPSLLSAHSLRPYPTDSREEKEEEVGVVGMSSRGRWRKASQPPEHKLLVRNHIPISTNIRSGHHHRRLGPQICPRWWWAVAWQRRVAARWPSAARSYCSSSPSLLLNLKPLGAQCPPTAAALPFRVFMYDLPRRFHVAMMDASGLGRQRDGGATGRRCDGEAWPGGWRGAMEEPGREGGGTTGETG